MHYELFALPLVTSPPIIPAAVMDFALLSTGAGLGDGAARPSPRQNKGFGRRTDGKILCPFHKEQTPSCQLYADGHYRCYGCGKHGWTDELDLDAATLAMAAHSGDDSHKLALALTLWDEAKPIAGTLAERYLAKTREIDLTVLPSDLNAVLRFHARCPFGPGARHPSMLALFRDVESDAPAGVHRIALTQEAQKVDRMMLGRWPSPRAIKLWPAAKTLVIGEGVETVLGAATWARRRGTPMPAAWVPGSSGSIAKFPPVTGVERLTILVDHDGNGTSSTDAKACAERWVAAGRTVKLLTPRQRGADFNDLARSLWS